MGRGYPAGEYKKQRLREKFSKCIGNTYNYLTLKSLKDDCNAGGYPKCLCVCICGKEKETTTEALTRGRVVSCGCISIAKEIKIGEKYNYLTVLRKYKNPNSHYDGYSYECKCDCGNIISVDRSYSLYSNNTKSCGCHKKDIDKTNLGRGHVKGEANPLYNPNVPEYRRKNSRQYMTSDFKKWRKSVYEKYNYTCDICNKRGGKLHAHHLNSFSKFPEQRFLIENGIVLCEGHHREFHSLYGKHSVYSINTKEQYLEYKEKKLACQK